MNIEIDYLYRDAGNNKLRGSTVFTNAEYKQIEEIERKIRESLIDELFFVPEEVGIKPLRFDTYDPELDHGWHEYSGASLTETQASSKDVCDISRLLELLKRSKLRQDLFYREVITK